MSAPVYPQKYLKYQKIVPNCQYRGWIKAREGVQDQGGLPSHVLHDYLLRSERWKKMLLGDYAAWAREVLVYPAAGDEFKKGIDVVDSIKDNQGRSWVFPASSMPEQAIGRANVGLFIDPEQVEVDGRRVVILADPTSIIFLEGFLQTLSATGKADKITRIPLAVSEKVLEKLPVSEKNCLYRLGGVGVRPLSRFSIREGHGRVVNTISDSHLDYMVAYVELQNLKIDQKLTFSDCLELVRCANISPRDMSMIISMFESNIDLFRAGDRQITPSDVSRFLASSNITPEFRFGRALVIADSVDSTTDFLDVGQSITAFVKKNPSILDAPRLTLDRYAALERRLSES